MKKKIPIIIFISLLFVLFSINVFADSSLVLSTTFPSIQAKAGEKLDFSIKVENNTSDTQEIDLSILSLPEGWEGVLEGNGRTVEKIIVDNNTYERVTLKMEIPENAELGDYKIVIEAKGKGIGDTLTLNVNIKEDIKQESKLSAEYPDLQGTEGTKFKFRVNLTNNSNESQSFSLEAGVPRGWQVSFSPAYSSDKIASINVEPNSNEGIDIEVIPPQRVAAGEYVIPVIAKSAEETLKQDLKVIIKGSYSVNLTTPTGKLSDSAYAGKEKEIKLIVENTGSGDLKDIVFSSWEPSNWSVEFEPKEIDVLQAGESKEVKAVIKPDGKALAGDYVVELRVNTPEATDSVEFRVTVKTPTKWGIIGALLILGLVSGLYYIFNKYGRR